MHQHVVDWWACWSCSVFLAITTTPTFSAPPDCKPTPSVKDAPPRNPSGGHIRRNQRAPSSFIPVVNTVERRVAEQEEQTYVRVAQGQSGTELRGIDCPPWQLRGDPPLEWTAFGDAKVEWERRRRARAAEDGPFA